MGNEGEQKRQKEHRNQKEKRNERRRKRWKKKEGYKNWRKKENETIRAKWESKEERKQGKGVTAMIVPRYYENLNILHDNRMPARAYYIPASVRMDHLVEHREESDRMQLLNGTWRFRYFDSV